MNQKEKIAIVNLLRAFVENKGSQNKAAAALKGASAAVVSHLLSGNWEPYSDDMFRKIGAQVGYNNREWQFAETQNSTKLLEDLLDAKQNAKVLSIVAPAGSGKSETTKKFATEHKNVFRVECGQYWTPDFFLSEIIQKIGIQSNSTRVPYMMRDIVSDLLKREAPMIIIDEVDKVDDKVLAFLITFYNELVPHCSIIISATHYLIKRINDGVRLQKKSYNEIKSRYGRYYEFEPTSGKDVKILCEAQGISDSQIINSISRDCRGDLRIARDLIMEVLRENNKKLTT